MLLCAQEKTAELFPSAGFQGIAWKTRRARGWRKQCGKLVWGDVLPTQRAGPFHPLPET